MRAPGLYSALKCLKKDCPKQWVDVSFLGRHHRTLHVLDDGLAHTHRGDDQLLRLDDRAVGGCQFTLSVGRLGLQADLSSELGAERVVRPAPVSKIIFVGTLSRVA